MITAKEYRIQLLQRFCLEKSYFCFDFSKPEGFEFTEGQFGVFGLANQNVEGRKLRAFSIASTSDEPFIRVATKIIDNPSPYKQQWMSMNVGDEITVNAPLGEFTLDESVDAVFIAGGIGITPIRSMILAKASKASVKNDLLIYSELESVYPFKTELEDVKDLQIVYTADIEPTQKAIKEAVSKYLNRAKYYLSGSPGFVRGLTTLLKEQGIDGERIKFDVFAGY